MMPEPKPSNDTLTFEPAGPAALLPGASRWDSRELLCAAPFACAALWAAVTGAAALFWAATGVVGPLDWCRSGGGLAGTAILTLTTLLAASAAHGQWGRRLRSLRQPRPLGSIRAEAPSGAEPDTHGAWRLETGGFTPISPS